MSGPKYIKTGEPILDTTVNVLVELEKDLGQILFGKKKPAETPEAKTAPKPEGDKAGA